MTKRNIFRKRIWWGDAPNKPWGLLKVEFESKEGQEFVWWPEWQDVRGIFYLAFMTEWNNLRSPKEWEEILRFEKTATALKTDLLDKVNKKTQEERQRIIELLNQGDFREAGKLLQSGLVGMAEGSIQSRRP